MRFIKRHLWVLIVALTVIAAVWEIRSMMPDGNHINENSVSLDQVNLYSHEETSTDIEKNDKPMLTVHLDFKGGPPNFAYLKTLLPKMAAAGCDSLLIEYEDMFPYKGKLVNLSATNHYSPSQVRELIGWAHDLGMQVIPLVQTFGHLESALKLREWANLRELYQYPSEICPSNPESFTLVTEMISQVMSYHRDSHFIHIGCDEVYHIDLCQKCRERSLSPRELFEDHVIKLAKWIKERYPNVRPLIWDDMMRKWSPEEVIKTRLGAHVIPMVWVYTENVHKAIQAKWWLYAKAFRKLWVASAYKGAGKPRSDFPHIERRLANQRSWLDLIHKSSMSHDVGGIVLTGWSRFDHFAILCELLPVSIPSLLLDILYVKAHLGGTPARDGEIYEKWQRSLGCQERIIPDNMNTTEGRGSLMECDWPGVDLYRSILAYRAVKSKVKEIEHLISDRHGWLTRYNVQHNFTNPARILDELIELGVNSNLRQIEKLRVDIYRQIVSYTDEYTANEWVEDRILPLTSSLMSLNRITEALMARQHWPRRPLQNNIPTFV